MRRLQLKRSVVISLFNVFIFLAPQPSFSKSLSKIGDSVRSDQQKLISGIEVLLQTSIKKKSWTEALELIQIIERLEPHNPLVGSNKAKVTTAFLAETIKNQKSAETKSLNKLRSNYLRELEKGFKAAKKKRDLLTLREALRYLIEIEPENKSYPPLLKKIESDLKVTDVSKVHKSKLYHQVEQSRSRYLSSMTRSLKTYESKNKSLPALQAAQLIKEIDPTNGVAQRVYDSVASEVQKAVMKKAKRNAFPILKKAKSAIEGFTQSTEKKLDQAMGKKDYLGALQCTRSVLLLKPKHKDALKADNEARSNIVKAADILGRKLKGEDLAWYKSEGKYAFDGTNLSFNSGNLGIGQMALDVVITFEIKASSPGFKYGWGAQKTVGTTAGSDLKLNGKNWVRFTVVATEHVGFWQVAEKTYRPTGIGHRGRLIVTPNGSVEIRNVRILSLVK